MVGIATASAQLVLRLTVNCVSRSCLLRLFGISVKTEYVHLL